MTKRFPSYRIFRNVSLPKIFEWDDSRKDAHLFAMFFRLFARMKECDLALVPFMP